MTQTLASLTSIRRSLNALFAFLVLGMASGLLLPGGAAAQVLIQNCASITSLDQVDSDPTNDSNCADVTVPVTADLSLTKTVDNSTPGIGATINFTLTLTNDGPSDAVNIVVNDPEPTGFTFVSGTPADLGDTWNGLTNDWTVASLASGASTTLVIQATVDAAGSYLNQAQVTVSGVPGTPIPDPDSTPNNGFIGEDDDASVLVSPVGAPPPVDPTPDQPVLTIDKAASPTLADSDSDGLFEATFTVTISNIGTAAGTYTVADTANLLPTGVSVSEIISLAAATDGANDPTPNLNPGFDGTGTTALLALDQTIDAAETHTYTVIVEYAVDTAAPGFSYAALACNGAPNNGFYNQATLTFNIPPSLQNPEAAV